MADTEPTPFAERAPGQSARVDRHRIALEAAATATAAPVESGEPAAAPAPVPAPVALPRVAPDSSAPTKDRTPGAIRRPALLSNRCLGCGASTTSRSGMVTELVEVGPIRALRVVACSACPDRRRRAAAGS